MDRGGCPSVQEGEYTIIQLIVGSGGQGRLSVGTGGRIHHHTAYSGERRTGEETAGCPSVQEGEYTIIQLIVGSGGQGRKRQAVRRYRRENTPSYSL